jgi:very-short-patch-repair endonuclease
VKEQHLQRRGFTVLRAHSVEIYQNLDGVLEDIYRALQGET